jgi:hypothetical protein
MVISQSAHLALQKIRVLLLTSERWLTYIPRPARHSPIAIFGAMVCLRSSSLEQ